MPLMPIPPALAVRAPAPRLKIRMLMKMMLMKMMLMPPSPAVMMMIASHLMNVYVIILMLRSPVKLSEDLIKE